MVAHYLGLNREYSPVAGKKIHWPGGREGPPADVPECGFLGNDPACTSRTEAYTFVAYSSLALTVFLLVAITATCVLYRLVIHFLVQVIASSVPDFSICFVSLR